MDTITIDLDRWLAEVTEWEHTPTVAARMQGASLNDVLLQARKEHRLDALRILSASGKANS